MVDWHVKVNICINFAVAVENLSPPTPLYPENDANYVMGLKYNDVTPIVYVLIGSFFI
jgi:hypothetical protein